MMTILMRLLPRTHAVLKIFVLMLSLTVALNLPVINSAQAAAPDAKIQALKTVFETFLSEQKTLADKSGGAQFEYDGEIMIEPAADYYAVTLPHIKVAYPDGSRVDIGMISINASAHVPGQWKMALAIPTPLLLRESPDAAPIKINIGTQKAAGIWDESLKGFAKLDAQYGNITINQPDAPYTLAINEARIVYDYTKNADATWTGPGYFALKETALVWPANKSTLKLAELKGEINLTQYNPAAVAAYRANIMGAADGTTPASQNTVLDQLSQLITSLGGGIKSGFTLMGLEITRPDPATNTPQTFTAKSGFARIDARNFAAEKAGLGIGLGFDGIATNPVPKGYEGVLPSSLNIDLDLADMPIKGLLDLGKTTYQATLENPAMTQLAGMSFLMKAPAILSAAGTGFNIKDSYIANSEYRFNMAGTAKADISAINFATGQFKGEFSGLDPLIKRLEAIANDPAHPMAGRATVLSQSLKTMQASGAVKPGTETNPIYTYDVVLDNKGQVLLNGKSMLGTTPATSPAPATP